MSTVPGAPNQRAAVLSGLRALADAGLLRQLDWALAQFIAEHDPEAAPELLVATALLAHFEGQGHSCLPLGGLRDRLLQLPGWSTAGQETLAALVQSAIGTSSSRWRRACARALRHRSMSTKKGCEPGWTVCSIRSRPAAAIGKNSPAPLHCARA